MKKNVKWAIIASVAVLAVAIGILVGTKLYDVVFNGDYQLNLFGGKATATPAASGGILETSATPDGATLAPDATATPEPTPTIDPYEQLMSEADTSILSGNIVNILLIGVDYEEARVEDWNGKGGNSFHSDVMMVLALNFDQNRADLISLPRDTYASIPNVKGIYKLNASLNCGTDGTNYGLFCKNGEGFQKVCDAAEWMLGGIEVNYYYAVTMESVKQLVDIVGGVWYEVEGDFDNGGRYYKAGYQFMDGQAVLDYMRVRKGGHTTMATSDSARVNRQKNMMVALFKSIRESNLLVKAPEILSTFSGGLYTNCTVEQTAALAAFGYKLNADDIGMYSMSGSGATLFHWNFVFTDQSNRVDIIQKIYGVKASYRSKYTKNYAQYTWADMLYDHYIELCAPLTAYVQALIDADDLLPEFSATPEATAEITPIPTATPTADYTAVPTATPEAQGNLIGHVSYVYGSSTELTRQYTETQRALYQQYLDALTELESCKSKADKEASKAANGSSNNLGTAGANYLVQLDTVQQLAIAVAKEFGYSGVKGFTIACSYNSTFVSGSAWGINYWDDKSINAVKVNFN